MNKNSVSFLGHNSSFGTSKPKVNPAILIVIFVAFSLVYLIISNILSTIGLGSKAIFSLTLLLPLGAYLLAIVTTPISGASGQESLEKFRNARGVLGEIVNAMAGCAEWFSLYFVIGFITALSASNHDGMAILSGNFIGMALMAMLILPRLTQNFSPVRPISSQTSSLPFVISSRTHGVKLAKKLLRTAISLNVVLCALLFLIAQIGAASQVIVLYFPMPFYWAAILLLAPVMVAILAGGFHTISIANMLLVWVIGAAILLPVIWMSANITGNPIPQLSYGNGALQPIMQLEQQLVLDSDYPLSGQFQQGNFTTILDIPDFLATLICMIAGTMALPLLYSRIFAINGVATRMRSMGWMLIIITLLISTLPAFVIFTKFEIYRDLIGLPLSQLEYGVEWLMDWVKFAGGHHVMICGQPAIDLNAIISACGNNPDHILMPADVQFSPVMTLLGAGDISNMPSIFSAITFAGVLSAGATTAGIALMVIINTASDELISESPKLAKTGGQTSMPMPVFRRLFISRVLLVLIVPISIWASLVVPVPVTDFSLWAINLAAGALFPALIVSIWWNRMTALSALICAIFGLIATFYLMISIEFGPDWIVQSGDETIWKLPFSDISIRTLNAAIAIIPAAIIIIVAISLLEVKLKKWRLARKQPGF